MPKRVGASKAAAVDTALHCYCHGPDTGADMIACEKCDKWFHGECIGISNGYNVEDVEYFHCGCGQKEIRYKKTSANAGGTDAAPSGTGGQASASKEKPEDNGRNKKLAEKNGRMTRSKKAAKV